MAGRFKRLLRPAVVAAGMAVAMVALAQDQNSAATSALMQAASPEVLPPASVDWAAVSRTYAVSQPPQIPYTRLKGFQAEQKALAVTQIPILLPGPGSLIPMDEARLVSLGEVYDVVVQPSSQPGLTITFSGTRVYSAALPGTLSRQKAQTIATSDGLASVLIDQSETGQSASFMRFGILYSVDIQCASDEAAAAYCNDEVAIRSLVSSLTEVVLGETSLRAMNEAGYKPSRNPRPTITNTLTRAVSKQDLIEK